jgi:hypothetical protein
LFAARLKSRRASSRACRRGKDYEFDGPPMKIPHSPYPMRGVGPFTHQHPEDRPPVIFGGKNTLHFGGGNKAPYVLLPVIPKA